MPPAYGRASALERARAGRATSRRASNTSTTPFIRLAPEAAGVLGCLFPARLSRALADFLCSLTRPAGKIRGKLEYIFLFQVKHGRTTRVENRTDLFY